MDQNMSPEDVVVLTKEQFLAVIAAGATQLGIVPTTFAGRSFGLDIVRNGAILIFEDSAPEPVEAKIESEDHAGPSEDEVKSQLVSVMTRAPSVATIRNWNSKQRRQAIKWAKSGGSLETKPEFVVEPKPRVRGSKARETSGDSTEKRTRGRRSPVTATSGAAPQKNGASEHASNPFEDDDGDPVQPSP